MKYLSVILIGVLFPCSTMAQYETLVKGEIESGWYGGPVLKTGQINGQTGIFIGGQGGWIVNHRVVVGGRFYMLANPVDVEDFNNIVMGFLGGGVLFEYIIASNKLVHFSIENMIGAGGVYNDVGDYSRDHDPLDYTGDACFMLEPGINLDLNITRNIRIGAGATYRYFNGVEYYAGSQYDTVSDHKLVTDADLRGASFQLVLKYGVF